jgi:hypothetical protein
LDLACAMAVSAVGPQDVVLKLCAFTVVELRCIAASHVDPPLIIRAVRHGNMGTIGGRRCNTVQSRLHPGAAC